MSEGYIEAKAVVAEQAGWVNLCEVRAPVPTDEDVVMRVSHSWISNGTEGSFVRGERIEGDKAWRPGDALPFPHVPGYQKCGIVESIGKNVSNVRPGDRVFASVSRVCDMFFDTGGHISPAVTHRSQVWVLPENVSEVAASCLVLLQVGYNCGMRPVITEGDYAVVFGDDMVGHWAAQTLSARGAHIALVGRHDERLNKYRLKDGDILINERRTSVLDTVSKWADNGVQAVVDTVGSISAFESLYPVMRHNGHLVSAGFYGEEDKLCIQPMRTSELTLHTPAGWTTDRMRETLQWLAESKLETEHLITHRFPAAQADKAFQLILSRREQVLGVVLDWE